MSFQRTRSTTATSCSSTSIICLGNSPRRKRCSPQPRNMPEVASFHESVKRGDLGAVEAALAQSPELLDQPNATGQSAFLLAKYYGQKQVADYLLARHPKLDIFTAAVAGDADRVLAFVKDDPAVLHTHSSDGWTPLHLAAFFGHPELAAALIDAGASVDARSTNAM